MHRGKPLSRFNRTSHRKAVLGQARYLRYLLKSLQRKLRPHHVSNRCQTSLRGTTPRPLADGFYYRTGQFRITIRAANLASRAALRFPSHVIDRSGKIEGIVIGVGGFLGMGEHDIKVEMNKLKFVDEPVRASSNTANNSTTGTANRSSTPTSSSSNANKWSPDHAVMTGASKDQLKSMPQFKYD